MTRPEPIEDVIVAEFGGQRPPGDAPLMIHEWPALLRHCEDSLQRRRTAYPAWIERKLMTEADARADIAAWEALVAEWTWIVSAEGTPPEWPTLRARIGAVELGLVRIKHEMDKGNRGHDILRQSHLLQALRWHLATGELTGVPNIHRLSRINHARRAELGQRWCGTCERWLFAPAHPEPVEGPACERTDCGLPRESREAA